MNRWLLAIGLVGLLAACVPVTRTPPRPYTGPVHGLLLAPLAGVSNSETGYSYLEVGVFSVRSFQTYFSLIDRSSLEALLKENRLSSIALLQDGTSAVLGRQIGARFVLKSTLTYARVESYQSGSAKYGYTTNYNGTAEVKMTLVQLETGRVVAAATRKGSSYGGKDYNSSKLTADAIQDAVNSTFREIMSQYAAALD